VRTTLILIATLCFMVHTTTAGSGGSFYSIFGLGDIRHAAGVRSNGMGFTGVGLSTTTNINGNSPASWSRIDRTRLEAGFLYEGFRSSDGSRSIFLANSDFNGALIAIPISPASGVVFVGGFIPYSNIDYELYTSGEQQGISYTIRHLGTGGLTKAQAGFSYAPAGDLSLGASLDYFFGASNHERLFTPRSSSFTGGTTLESSTINGIGGTFGVMLSSLGGLSESLGGLSVGVVVTAQSRLNTEEQTTYESSSLRDSSAIVFGKVTLPFSLGVGVAYQAGERVVLAADYFAQQWGSARFNGLVPGNLRNSVRIGIGGERLPSRERGDSWLERSAYRAGAYYHATYFRINGEPINEWGFTAGFGVPLTGESRLNTAFELGFRGTTKNNLIKDTIFRISVSLNVSELWFVRYEED
jgi:hypothetical protein